MGAETVVETLRMANINFQDFSYIHSSNALDHTQDPVSAFRAISRIIPTSQTAGLTVNRNIAIKNKGRGLHQWNFELENGHLIVRTHQLGVPFERLPAKNLNLELACEADLVSRPEQVEREIGLVDLIHVELRRRNQTEVGCNSF